jgi:hypothetical protein
MTWFCVLSADRLGAAYILNPCLPVAAGYNLFTRETIAAIKATHTGNLMREVCGAQVALSFASMEAFVRSTKSFSGLITSDYRQYLLQ